MVPKNNKHIQELMQFSNHSYKTYFSKQMSSHVAGEEGKALKMSN